MRAHYKHSLTTQIKLHYGSLINACSDGVHTTSKEALIKDFCFVNESGTICSVQSLGGDR